ncbi:MAG: hypothetical protein Fur0039_22060 [Rhodocyclaceae bacterium]
MSTPASGVPRRASPQGGAGAQEPAAAPRLLAWAAIAYLAFVIYGSLVPLAFRTRPLAEAWEAFRDIRYLSLGIGSRADWVANILLFVPLAFLWTGLLSGERASAARRMFASILVLAGSAALAVAIEFTQIFFPPRTVSLNDILAESIGAAAGIALWLSSGQRTLRYLAGWSRTAPRAGTAARLLAAYLFILFGYSLLPLDLTISPIEIFHKWSQGKIILVPFGAPIPDLAQRVYALASDAAVWVPAALLWQMSSALPVRRTVLRVTACAAALELLQLFVYSRVTDVTDILTAAAGAVVGALLAVRLAGREQRGEVQGGSRVGRIVLGIMALLAWIGVLAAVFWYPFDFDTEWGFVHRRLDAVPRVPFLTYYYGTEFRAVTEVLHKTGFFFPLGMLAAFVADSARRLAVPGWVLHTLAIPLMAGTAAMIEAGQLFLPGKYADPTDWVLEFGGAAAGYLLSWKMFARAR